MRCFVHTREETVGHIHVGDITGSGLCSFDDTQLPKLEIISCICWTCCRCANALWPRVIIFTNKSLIWNTLSVISDWPGIELAGAYVIGYDLLHVPWNVMGHLPGHGLFFFSSSPCESVLIRGKTTMFAQFKFASHFEDNSGVHVFCRGHCHLVDENMNQH